MTSAIGIISDTLRTPLVPYSLRIFPEASIVNINAGLWQVQESLKGPLFTVTSVLKRDRLLESTRGKLGGLGRLLCPRGRE